MLVAFGTEALMTGTLLAWALLGGALAQAAVVAAPPKTAVSLGDAEMEAFLTEGKVLKTRGAGGGGITGALRATLRHGDAQHDALVQSIDEEKSFADLGRGREIDFRDSYRNNAAAYRLDRLLGLGMVPVTVVRMFEGKRTGFTWWVDDVLMDERARMRKKQDAPDVTAWNRQMWVVRVFDQLIYNTDRNLGNLLIDKSWRLWMIDHTRAFKIFEEPKSPVNLSTHCARGLLDALRRLDHDEVASATRDLLSSAQVKGLMARRDFICRDVGTNFVEDVNGATIGILYTLTIPNLPDGFYQYKYYPTFADDTQRWCSDRPCGRLRS
jgi:hypothetical protein